MKKRIFSVLLAIMLIITMLPANLVFAEDEPATVKDVIEAGEDGIRPDGTPDNYVKVTVNFDEPVGEKTYKVFYVTPDHEVYIPALDVEKAYIDKNKGIIKLPDNADVEEMLINGFYKNQRKNFPAYFNKSLKGKFTKDTEIKMLYGEITPLILKVGDIFDYTDIFKHTHFPEETLLDTNYIFDPLHSHNELDHYSIDSFRENGGISEDGLRLDGLQDKKFGVSDALIDYIQDTDEDIERDDFYLRFRVQGKPLFENLEDYNNPIPYSGQLISYPTYVYSVLEPENKNNHINLVILSNIYIVDDVIPQIGDKEPTKPDYYVPVEFKTSAGVTINDGEISKYWVTNDKEIEIPAPKVTVDKSHNFEGWDKQLKGTFTENTVINAKISEIPLDKENIVKMEIASEPSKMSYIDGDELDLTGLKIKLTDKNNIEKVIELKDLAEYGITTEPTNKTKLTVKDNDKTIIVKKEGLDNVETKGKLSVTNAVFIPNKPALTEVENLDKITEEEKTKVKEEIIKANPDIKTEEITVNDNGSVIIKHDGKTGTLKPKETIVKKSEDKKDNEKYPANKPEKKTEVVNKEKLTPEEKAKVKEEVKKTNPKAKDIEVKDNGDVVITYPDGSTNELKQEDTVIQKKTEDTKKDNEKYPVVKPEKVGVKDIDDLTYREKLKVEEAIKKVNPHAKYINVKDNGDTIITYPDGSTNELKQKDTVYKYKESREPFVDRVYEGDEYITGKGEPYSYIEITLENKRMLSGKTDRNGDFKIKCPYELRKDDVIEVVQYEDLYDASKPVVVRVEGPRDPKDKLIKDEHSAYIVGYPNGQFGPNNTITRAEVAAMLARLSRNQTVRRTMNFSDVKYGDWFYNAVNIGVSEGFIKGYFDGTFRPNEPITRAEFAAAISTYADNVESEHKFKDVKGWSAGYIDTAYANGWMKGYDRNTFRPDNCLTRAEAVSTINRMLNRRPDKKFIDKELSTYTTRNKFFSDVNGRDWFFYDVYEATWGHDYEAKKDVETWTKVTGKTFILR